jgi:hypothetical protein
LKFSTLTSTPGAPPSAVNVKKWMRFQKHGGAPCRYAGFDAARAKLVGPGPYSARPAKDDAIDGTFWYVGRNCRERGRIRDRQREGIVQAKARGVFKGGKVRFDPAIIRQKRTEGMAPTEIARHLACNPATVFRALRSAARPSPAPVRSRDIPPHQPVG